MNIRVVLQKDTPAQRSGLRLPPAGRELVLAGTFPEYWVTNGMCGCGSVNGQDGSSLPEDTIGYIQHFLGLAPVKRVEVQWWWGGDSDRPSRKGEERLTIQRFEDLNAAEKLVAGTVYRVSDLRKFGRDRR